MPKSSSERSSKSEFSDSEFVFGGVKFNGGIDKGDAGGERDGDLWGGGNVGGGEGGVGGGGEGDMGGDGDLVCGDCDVEGRGDRDLGGGDLCLFRQARRVPGESGGGIGIAGEPRGSGEGDLGGGIFAYFTKQGQFWERVEGELVLQGNPHVVLCPCFSLDLYKV